MKLYKEHIYSLEDRHETDISSLWQVLQVLFFTCCIIFGYTVCFMFGLALSTTQYNCVLYSNLSFAPNHTDSSGRPIDIKSVNSEFPPINCELVLYIPVVVSTFACFFAVMFAYCGRGGAGNQGMQEAWRIIMPTVFFNLTSLCLIAYMANVFQSGLKQFLRSVATAWGRVATINLDEISHLRLDDANIGNNLIRYMSLTKQTTWLLLSSWGLNFLWILMRLLFNVDFQLVRTTIHVYPKKQTVIQKMRGPSKQPSLSENSTASSSSSDSNGPSVRLRTVQFTPSTRGWVPTSEVREDISLGRRSSEAEEEPLEIEIAEVKYNNK